MQKKKDGVMPKQQQRGGTGESKEKAVTSAGTTSNTGQQSTAASKVSNSTAKSDSGGAGNSGGGGGGPATAGGKGFGGKGRRGGSSASKGGGGSGGGSGNASRSYPRGVGLDFRKLAGLTLLGYIDHHGVPVRAEAPPSELAVAVARHFEHLDVDEEECIGGFLERLEKGSSLVPTEYSRKTAFYDGHDQSQAQRKRRRSKWAARQGEQVAAKVTRTDENGSWILASVQRFYNDTETYDVQDEDDTSKLIRLPWSHVMRLSTGMEGCFQKDTDCMAIFPETTSFYRAKVSKSPVWKIDRSGNPMVKEIIVQFEDDEDTQGRTPHRRVPSRYVIPIPQDYFHDESEEMMDTTGSAGAPVSAAVTPVTVAAGTAK